MKREDYKKIVSALAWAIYGSPFEHKVYTVGGCERDYILQREEINDIDIVVSLPNGGTRLALWLKEQGLTEGEVVTYEHFGTAMFRLKDFPNQEIEAVQTRKECYRDVESRNPETAYGTVLDDASRRDFTYNAIYRNVTDGKVYYFNKKSEKDLKENVLRTCGDPKVIFDEDPLRCLRLCRFAARFGSKIEKKTFRQAKKHIERLSIVSKERICDELTKMLSLDNRRAAKAIELLERLGFFRQIMDFNFPSYIKKVVKRLRTCEEPEVDILEFHLAMLLGSHFYKLKEFKFSNKVQDDVEFYVRNGFELCWGYSNRLFVRKLMNKCKDPKVFVNVCLIADLPPMYSLMEEEKKFFDYKFPINGDDIMKAFDLQPSVLVKEVLNRMHDIVLSHPEKWVGNEKALLNVKYLSAIDYLKKL